MFPADKHARLTGTIDETHIYDESIPSLHQIDTAQVGSTLVALLRDIKMSRYDNEARVSLSLLNSRIAGCQQVDFDGQPCFHLLGLKQTQTLEELGTLDSRMAELGLSPYAVCSMSPSLASLQTYDAKQLREAQNIQWAEDLYELAQALEAQSKY